MRRQGHLDAHQHQVMIHHSGVIQAMNMQHGANSWVFQHAGVSPHGARTTRDFLAPLCVTPASDLQWPANSPDINVIDNFWLIRQRRRGGQVPQTPDQLWQQGQTAWNEITAEEVNHLVQSFASRLRVSIALHGESLNGQGNVHRLLMDHHTAGQIIALREQETGILFIDLILGEISNS
jgi:hypothetical protein